jgi:hypothetical protein
MRLCLYTSFGVCLSLFFCLPVHGQASFEKSSLPSQRSDDDDPKVILEVGAATGWNTTGGAATFAPNMAAETTPIENWDTDLLCKKPWTLSPRAEFMLGVGPEWVHLSHNGRTKNSVAGELAGDFMFWPNGRHHFGWFLEPAYDYSFAGGHPQSIGLSAGFLIGLARRHP